MIFLFLLEIESKQLQFVNISAAHWFVSCKVSIWRPSLNDKKEQNFKASLIYLNVVFMWRHKREVRFIFTLFETCSKCTEIHLGGSSADIDQHFLKNHSVANNNRVCDKLMTQQPKHPYSGKRRAPLKVLWLNSSSMREKPDGRTRLITSPANSSRTTELVMYTKPKSLCHFTLNIILRLFLYTYAPISPSRSQLKVNWR